MLQLHRQLSQGCALFYKLKECSLCGEVYDHKCNTIWPAHRVITVLSNEDPSMLFFTKSVMAIPQKQAQPFRVITCQANNISHAQNRCDLKMLSQLEAVFEFKYITKI